MNDDEKESLQKRIQTLEISNYKLLERVDSLEERIEELINFNEDLQVFGLATKKCCI